MKIDAIKIKTVVPQGFVVAGKPFSLTTIVTNPHDEPIQIVSYLYHIPYQVQWIHDGAFDTKYAEHRAFSPLRRLFTASLWRAAASAPGTPMSYGRLPDAPPGPVQTIAPGESQIYSFRAMMPHWLFITGGQLTFQGVVMYQSGTEAHTSTFEVTFPFRPPLKATTFGAVAGSFLGTVAKLLKESGPSLFWEKPGEAVTATALAIILSIIAVVYSSRRSNDVQPVLTVEDVWGGIILGFMIGYLGNDFFQKLVPISQ